MAELKQQYDEKLVQKEELRRKAEHTEMMLDRASKLVSGLADERARWENTVQVRACECVQRACVCVRISWFFKLALTLSPVVSFSPDKES